jgi:hypothetical protein
MKESQRREDSTVPVSWQFEQYESVLNPNTKYHKHAMYSVILSCMMQPRTLYLKTQQKPDPGAGAGPGNSLDEGRSKAVRLNG